MYQEEIVLSSVTPQLGSLSNYYSHIGNNSKIEVPVPSSLTVYAQYKHVRGIAAESTQQAVSLNRAQMIDNMVAFLNSSSSEDLNLDSEKNSFTLQELGIEMKKVINDTPVNFQTLPGSSVDKGLIFSMRA